MPADIGDSGSMIEISSYSWGRMHGPYKSMEAMCTGAQRNHEKRVEVIMIIIIAKEKKLPTIGKLIWLFYLLEIKKKERKLNDNNNIIILADPLSASVASRIYFYCLCCF